MRTLVAWAVLGLTTGLPAAEPSLSDIVVEPAEFTLEGARDRQQLLVTGTLAEGPQIDVTRSATFEIPDQNLAVVTAQGLVIPRGHGSTHVIVRTGGHERQVIVHVNGGGRAAPVDFETEAIAALSRSGCNQGACHGSPQGKSGFRLSLRGFDPALDFVTLAREDAGRRTNPQRPEESLILKKGGNDLPHQGGRRFRHNDAAYQVLRQWIEEGCRRSAKPTRLLRLEVIPALRQVPESHPRQQLVARAHFADGRVRDVTHLCVFSSSHDAAASVSAEGVVDFQKTGEVTVLVRYLDRITGARFTHLRRDPAFAFQSPPAVNYVDELTFKKQRELQLRPSPLVSDEIFLRRVYLDVIGQPPSAEEARAFLDSTDPQKRAKLIDALLARDEYASFWALKWADVMRGSDVTISRRGVHSFHRYLVQLIRDDRPFDQFARETLTSLGNTLYKPGANFHRIARTPEDAAEAMAQLFLGVRIGCAKCHNHPFEAITQDDYYGLAAYFARVRFKGTQFGLDDEIVYLERGGDVRHPTKNVILEPAAFGEKALFLEPDDDRRQRLVEWLVRPDNKYFAPSIVNRVWFHLFGRGLVEPVDDFRATNPPSNPELLDALARDFVQQGFRIKPVLRLILNSSTYQLSSTPVPQSPQAAEAEKYFTHPKIRMLTAEQILDAVSAATGVPQHFPGYPAGTRAIELAEGDLDHPFLRAFSKPVRDQVCECGREEDPSLSQVIHLLNNPEIVTDIASSQSRINRWLAEGKTDDEATELMYLATLSRRPTASEREVVRRHIAMLGDRAAALQDVQHALLNANEFLLRH